MKKILIIEDDSALLSALVELLEAEHYKVVAEQDGEKGFLRAKRENADLLILDLLLPGKNGIDICRDLRNAKVTTPILMLTSKGAEADKVAGFELGADDYVTKPFSSRELVARVKALIRRQTRTASHITDTAFGDIVVDFSKQEITKGTKRLDMSAKEFQLLQYFIEREGIVITRHQLLDEVWGYEATPTTRTVDNYILSLRKKIETRPSKPKHLLTVHRAGYKFIR